MEEEKKDKVETGGSEKNYIDVIQKLKADSVDKKEYEKVLKENKQLLDTLVSGKQEEKPAKKEETVNIDELRDNLFNKDNNNLEYTKKALKLRKELMEKGEVDPFLPNGTQIKPDMVDEAAADKVAKILEHCIEYAEGDSEVFTNELQRVMVDSGPSRRR